IVERKHYEQRLRDEGSVHGKTVVRDRLRGLSVLQLDRLPKGLTPFRLAEKSPKQGAKVHSIGSAQVSGAMWGYSPGEVRSVYPRKLRFSKDPADTLDCKIIETT